MNRFVFLFVRTLLTLLFTLGVITLAFHKKDSYYANTNPILVIMFLITLFLINIVLVRGCLPYPGNRGESQQPSAPRPRRKWIKKTAVDVVMLLCGFVLNKASDNSILSFVIIVVFSAYTMFLLWLGVPYFELGLADLVSGLLLEATAYAQHLFMRVVSILMIMFLVMLRALVHWREERAA